MISFLKSYFKFFLAQKRRKRSTQLSTPPETDYQVRIPWISTAARIAPRLAPKQAVSDQHDGNHSPSSNSQYSPPPLVPVNLDIEDIEDGDKKKKKARTTFTGKQIFELEKQFETKKYLSSNERMDLARGLNVTETQVSSFCCFILIYAL